VFLCIPAAAAAAALLLLIAGNTIHLQRPDTISARCSRYTYGVNVMRPPMPECHRLGHICKDGKGNALCDMHFRPLVRVGDIVQVGEFCGPLTVYPTPKSKTASVDVWVTPHRDASHVTEPKMRKLGTVKVDVCKAVKKKWGLPVGTQSSKDYQIDLFFKFGAADMQVRASEMHVMRKTAVLHNKYHASAAGCFVEVQPPLSDSRI
jgi:hypothetical protein